MTEDVSPSRTREGLSSEEAARRLDRDGPNEIPEAGGRGVLRIATAVLTEPMILLLLAAAGIHFLLGDPGEASLLLGSIGIVVAIEVAQERRTETALASLRRLASPRALVLRDGVRRKIPARELVVGDLALLEEGDRVAADAVVSFAHDLAADESLLTGESVPVRKSARTGSVAIAEPGGDDTPFVFAGTLLTRGHGLAEVLRTGPRTEMGRIGRSLEAVQEAEPRVARETRRIVRAVSLIALVLCAAAALLDYARRGEPARAFLSGITLAIAILPEELPVVLSVFLALGARRIARKNVLARRSSAIESLGAVTVLCVDKTGTLTENRMEVAFLDAGEPVAVRGLAPPAAAEHLAFVAALATDDEGTDPMDRAIRELAGRSPGVAALLAEPRELVHDYAVEPPVLAMAHVFRFPDGRGLVAAKGAPESILAMCAGSGAELADFERRAAGLASRGDRVLAVASGEWDGALPEKASGFRLRPVGFVALADPLRPAAAGAVAELRAAGIRLVMITGDHPTTAGAIAGSAGFARPFPVALGRELPEEPAALAAAVAAHDVFARVPPATKLRIVEALRAGGEVVAMTGDGVNDAPALRAADVGIAMGGRGSDVAREASALVLLDDDLASIPPAVRLGRRVFGNLRAAMGYLVSVHVPIAGGAIVPLVFGWEPLLGPVHLVLFELVIDPACSVAFEVEPEPADTMDRPPRPPEEPVLDRPTVRTALLRGTLLLAALVGMQGSALHAGLAAGELRALVVTALLAGNIGLLLGASRRRAAGIPSGRTFAALLAALLLAAALGVPPLREALRFTLPPWHWIAVALAAGLLPVPLLRILGIGDAK